MFHWNLISPAGGLLLLAVTLARYRSKGTPFRWVLIVSVLRSLVGIVVIALGPLLEVLAWFLCSQGIGGLKIVWWGINSEIVKLTALNPNMFLLSWVSGLPFAVLPGIATALTTLRPRRFGLILKSAALASIGTLFLADVIQHFESADALTPLPFSALSDLVGGAIAGLLVAVLGMGICPGSVDEHSFLKHWRRNAHVSHMWIRGHGVQIVCAMGVCLSVYFVFIYHPPTQIRATITDWNTISFRYRPAEASVASLFRPPVAVTVNLDPGELLVHPPTARLDLELQLLEGSLPDTRVPLIVASGGAEVEGKATASGTETTLIRDNTNIMFAKGLPVGHIVVTAPQINLLFGFLSAPSDTLWLSPPFRTRVIVSKDARFFRMLEPGKLLFRPRSSGRSVVVVIEGEGARLGLTTGQRLVLIPNAPGLTQPSPGADGVRVSLPGEATELFLPPSPSSCHCGPYVFLVVGDGVQRYTILMRSQAKYIELSEPGYEFGKEDTPALIEDLLVDAEGSVVVGNSEKSIPLVRPNTLTVTGSKLSMYRLPNSHIEVRGETQLAVLNGTVLTTAYWGHLPETYQAAIIGAVALVLLTALTRARHDRRRV